MFLFGPAPPESLVCITGTLRWTGRGWRSRVSGANAFMLLIQLLSGVIPACQFVWAADLHNEFILATVLHTLPPSLPSLSLSSTPLSVLQLLPLLSPSLSLSLSLLPLVLPLLLLSTPLILLSSSLPSAQRAECLNANEPHFQTDATAQVCLAHNSFKPRWEVSTRDGWMEMMETEWEKAWWKWREEWGFLEVPRV